MEKGAFDSGNDRNCAGSGGCCQRAYQFSNATVASYHCMLDYDTVFPGTTMVKNRKVKDRWGSHRSFEGSINN